MLNSKMKTYLRSRNIGWIVLVIPLIIITLFLAIDDGKGFSNIGTAVYRNLAQQKSCPSNSREGDAGKTHGEETREGIKYNVRTPENYDETIAHPLLVVYAPANANRAKSEKLTHLTYEATTAGFIIAYADNPDLSTSSTVELGTIPKLIAKKWCVDEERIYLTGHSDGGTVSMALAFMNGTREMPTAIAPSAAGVNYQDLSEHSCPKPISVMVMHSKKDRLFRDYGSEALGWWAGCNGCSPIPKKLENGCIAYTDCDNNVKTWYCEGDKPHSKWPQLNKIMLDFLASSKRIR